jgi:hypothetical protein
VRHRCAEERDDGIADELLDRAAVALELVPEAGVIRREQCPDVLGIELLGARGEPDEIGEENGEDLALLPLGRTRGIELGATRPAELEASRIFLAANRTVLALSLGGFGSAAS